jgi:deoxyribodipyrimidine photolyase-related protein
VSSSSKKSLRNLVLVLGDQLDPGSPAFKGYRKSSDAVWMAEVEEESNHVWSHKARIALFLSAMRHFRDGLKRKGYSVHYRELGDSGNRGALEAELERAARKLEPEKLLVVEPGEYRIRESLEKTAKKLAVPLEIVSDSHFLCSREEFEEHAEGRKQLRMEFFYREMRKRNDVLMDGDYPAGGEWNFDSENRESFGREGPDDLPEAFSVEPDSVTRDVIKLVKKRFADHPGSLDRFRWPVKPDDAKKALRDFVRNRLPEFGPHQDAMWTGEPFLNHSLLSSSLNLKLLNPRDVIAAAEKAYRREKADIGSVEGFIRQILGWREYVRGVYWKYMPDYLERNELGANLDLPGFYWTGETDMNCLRHTVGQTLEYGYAHHIQRLMVTGLFALLFGIDPKKVHEWYLAIYVDAVEWVELPNTLGMSQFGDGGIMGSKPYAASGKYIQRMSNYCSGCRYDPGDRTGEKACPFTTLYWDFLIRHKKKLAKNPRMRLQLRNVDRIDGHDRGGIRRAADEVRNRILEEQGRFR